MLDAILRLARPGLEPLIRRLDFEPVRACWCGGLLEPWLAEFEPYRRCVQCGLKAVAWRPTAASLRKFYEQSYWREYTAAHGCPSLEQRYESDALDRIPQYMAWVRELAAPPARVLEIGCGNGRLSHELSKAGYRCQATEMDAALAVDVRRKTGVSVTPGGLEELPPDGLFDVVVALDVIEHVADPVSFVREIRRRLAPMGAVLVHCPLVNHDDEAKGLRGMFNPISHLWIHTEASLVRLLGIIDLKPRRMGRIFDADCFGFSPGR